MPKPKIPSPPRELGTPGRKLWREILADAADQGLTFDPRDLSWLATAASCADRIAVLEAELINADLVVKGHAGQPVAHPLLGEIRLFRALQAQTLARLRTDLPETGTGGNRFRAAAMTRWHGA